MVLRKEIFLVHGGLCNVLETTETVSRSLEQGHQIYQLEFLSGEVYA